MKWAVLVPADKLPPILRMNHWDWPWPFQWVPRRWFAFVGGFPRKLFGNAPEPLKPIPNSGEWYFAWPPYFTFKTKSGWHFRIGFRPDDIDRYYQLSITLKRYR